MRRLLLVLAVSLLCWPQLAAQSPVVAHDLDGRPSSPLVAAPGQINLLLFVSAECPISAHYAPEMDRIAAEYAKKNVHTWLVYADPSLTPAAARENLATFHPHTVAVPVIDTGFTLTTAVDARVTPEAFVYTATGRAYRGRIDDLYLNIGQARRGATQHDLRLALDAVIAGQPVKTPDTPAVGCYIERKHP